MIPEPSNPLRAGTTIVTIVDARPQLIKAAAVSRALRAAPGMREVLVHTGQRYDENMSAVFFEELEIPLPDYHLGIGSGPHGAQTGRMLEAIKLAAAKLHLLVAHVEAGLRSFNRRIPSWRPSGESTRGGGNRMSLLI